MMWFGRKMEGRGDHRVKRNKPDQTVTCFVSYMEPGHKPEKGNISWVWWHTPERVRQRDGEFEASLDFMIKLCLKNKTKQKNPPVVVALV